MSLLRLSARIPLRSATPRLSVRRLTQNSPPAGSDSYASTGGHSKAGTSSDMPWLIGSLAVTIPSAIYLLMSAPKKDAHGHGHDAHAAVEHAKESAAGYKDAAKEKAGELMGSAKEQVEDDESIGEKAGNVADAAKEKAGEVTDAAKEKAGEVKDAAKEKADASSSADLKEKAGEAKDAAKEKAGEVKDAAAQKASEAKDKAGTIKQSLGSDSTNSKTQSVTSKTPSESDPPAAGQKDVGSTNEMSGKQEGLTNKDTWHAVLHDERGDALSKKSEGSHETAKVKGTVDVNRDPK